MALQRLDLITLTRRMHDVFHVKYRTAPKGLPPRPIKLQIPGWAGASQGHRDGDQPMPWHCPPFVDGATYGLELLFCLDVEWHVRREGGSVLFEAFDLAGKRATNLEDPFMMFADGHFGMPSFLDIAAPEGYALRLEPHPRFYTDQTGTCPIAVAGHLQSWWPKVFFAVFKAPREGERHIFRPKEPYAQVIFVPARVEYRIQEMSPEEKQCRQTRENKLYSLRNRIAKHIWTDDRGHSFDDKYRVLKAAYQRGGDVEIDRLLCDIEGQVKLTGSIDVVAGNGNNALPEPPQNALQNTWGIEIHGLNLPVEDDAE